MQFSASPLPFGVHPPFKWSRVFENRNLRGRLPPLPNAGMILTNIKLSTWQCSMLFVKNSRGAQGYPGVPGGTRGTRATRGTSGAHPGHPRGTSGAHLVHIRGTSGAHQGHIPGTSGAPLGHIRGESGSHQGHIQGDAEECSQFHNSCDADLNRIGVAVPGPLSKNKK